MLPHALKRKPNKPRQTAVGRVAHAWLILVLLLLLQNLLPTPANALSTPSTSRTGVSVCLSNGYDPLDRTLNRRLWKEQFRDKDGNSLTQAQRTHYLYADEGLIAEATQAIILNQDGSTSSNSAAQISTQYGPKPNSEWGTGPLFIKTPNSNGQASFAYYHHDQQQTPVQATDKVGNIVWAASYAAFGKASITTPQATANKPTITSNLRLPGQYEDAETGLHYNYRRYYDADIGRYISQDPIGLEGGLNPYQYANADPINQTDATGECPQCAAFAVCMASCALTTAAENAITGECHNWGNTAKDCAVGCAVGMGLGKLFQWGKKAWDRLPCAVNSFPADTVVHAKPQGASLQDAQQAQATLKAISQLQVGDEVLAIAEWKDKGTAPQQDQRLSYEKVMDIFTSYKEQTLIHLTLANGEQLTATEGHPFKTLEGWRDAVMLKKGGKLLLKGGDETSEPAVEITDIQTERKTLPVFNIEVANAHTYFVGIDGVGVHNDGHHCWPKYLGGPFKQKLADLKNDLHKLYHKGLDKVAPRQKGKAYYDKLPSAEKDKVLDKLKEYTENFDKQHGTDLLNGARNNGFPK